MPIGAAPTLAAAAVSIGIPLLFLYLVRRLDLYASTERGAVAVCLGWGLVAFGIAYGLGSAVLALDVVSRVVVIVAVAPVVEEVVKSVVLADQVRRPSFTYFVDGAILGFATGTGFAMIENIVYLLAAPAADGLGLSVNRAFGASLMHGTACALVGVALGRWRFGRGARRAQALLGGLAAAIALHAAFNGWTAHVAEPSLRVYGAIGIGLCGVVVVALMIAQGLREERSWLREALSPDVGVTEAEAGAVQRLRQVRTLLAPVEAHFGAQRAADVAELLRLQARFGLKRQAAALAQDGTLKEQLADEAAALRRKMDAAQRSIGVYVMAYVRAVWPSGDDTLWARLDEAVAAAEDGADNLADNLWQMLGDRAASIDGPPRA